MRPLFFLCFLLAFYNPFVSGNSVNVTIFYRASCPYSRKFVRVQLLPAYKILGENILKIRIFPATRRTYEDGVPTSKCGFNKEECISQSYAACVLTKNYTWLQKIGFLDCQMNIKPISNVPKIKKCAKKFHIRWKNIKRCHKNKNGVQILKVLNEMQHSRYDVTHVPFVIFNEVVDADIDRNGRNRFLATVCSYLKKKPLGCP